MENLNGNNIKVTKEMAYKGFNKDLSCKGFQYEIGKEYEMDGKTEKNNLAYLLHKELLKTAEKFIKKCPKTDHNVILGAGNLCISGFLINAPTKKEALETHDSCVEIMRNAIEITPDHFFGGGIRNHFNPNLN